MAIVRSLANDASKQAHGDKGSGRVAEAQCRQRQVLLDRIAVAAVLLLLGSTSYVITWHVSCNFRCHESILTSSKSQRCATKFF